MFGGEPGAGAIMRLVLSLPRYHHGMLKVTGRGRRDEPQIPLRTVGGRLGRLGRLGAYCGYCQTRFIPDVNSQARDGTHKGTAAVDF